MAIADTVRNDLSWIQKHERVIVVALVLAVGSFGLSKYFDASAARATARATVAEQVLAAQKTQDAQFAVQTAQLTQQYQQLASTLAAQNAALATALAQRQAAVAQNQANNAALALPALANRLKTLGNAPDGSVSVSGDSVNLTHPGALAITDTLETIPALQGNLRDTQALLGATQVAKAKGDEVIGAQGKEIVGLNLQITDADKACKADVKAAKAEGKKNAAKWFLRGAIVGFIGGLLAH